MALLASFESTSQRGQPLYKGQNLCSKIVHYSKVLLYTLCNSSLGFSTVLVAQVACSLVKSLARVYAVLDTVWCFQGS